MGDAFLPLGDDIASGIFYNPANLGKMRKAEVSPVNFAIYGNSGFLSSISTNSYNVINLGNYLPNLQAVPGQWAGSGQAMVASVGVSAFSFSLLAQSETAGQYNGGSVTYRSQYQLIPAVGTGFRLFQGILRVGYSLQWVNQAVGVQTVSASSSMAYNEGLAQGSGFSHNVGIALTAPVHFLPSINVVARNLFDTTYSSYSLLPMASNPTGAPAVDPMTVDASFSIQPRLGRGTVINLVIVDRDVFNRTGVALMGHLSIGAELSFRDSFYLRAGWNGGYPTAGLGVKRSRAEINLTWYTEEIGTQYMGQGDSRFMFQYQLRAF
jgi:hypothetical protein